jgi:hypothetical protein
MQGSAYRGFYKTPGFMDNYVGFRVVARPSNLQITTISTNIGFARNSGIFELSVVCNNPRSANPLNWFLDNAPAGLSLQSDGGDTVRLLVNTYGSFTGAAVRITVYDGTATASVQMNVSEIVHNGSLRVILGPDYVLSRGAMWRILAGGDTNWVVSGGTVTNLAAPGTYAMECKPVMYWTVPGGQAVDIAADQLTVVGANYAPDVTVQGTPKYWLDDYGISPDNIGDVLDSDEDGHLNWMEYQAGTCPTNKDSVLRITGVSTVGGTVRIDWKGGTVARQYLMIRNTLNSTSEVWSAIYTNLPPTAVSNFVLDAGATNEALFYSIKAER